MKEKIYIRCGLYEYKGHKDNFYLENFNDDKFYLIVQYEDKVLYKNFMNGKLVFFHPAMKPFQFVTLDVTDIDIDIDSDLYQDIINSTRRVM